MRDSIINGGLKKLEVILCPWEKQLMSFVANAKQNIMLCASFIKVEECDTNERMAIGRI